jgi:hypothetical protein
MFDGVEGRQAAVEVQRVVGEETWCLGYVPRVYDLDDSVGPWGVSIGPYYNKIELG